MFGDGKKNTGHEELEALRVRVATLSDALRRSEARLTTILESLPFDFWVMDENGRYELQNETSRRHWGEAVGEHPETIAHASETRARWERNNQRAFAGETVRGEVSYVHNGETRYFEEVIVPVLDNGRVRGILGVNHDITDRKRLATRMAEEQRWLEDVLDSSPIPLLLIDAVSGRMTFANRSALAMYGGAFPLDIPRDRYLEHFRLTDANDRELPVDEWPSVRASRGDRVEGQMVVFHTPDGKFPVLVSGEMLPARLDHPATVVLGFQDVSELVSAIRARDEFLSIASHELKTPLTSLKLQVQLRERALAAGDLSAFTPEALARMVSGDARHVDRLTRLVDDMLDVAHISAGRFSLEIGEPVDLVELVRDVTERSAPALASAGCSVTIDAPVTVFGRWDRGRIEQVVAILLMNAWKYGRGKPIHLTVRSGDRRAVLAVRDEGIGISAADQQRIFEIFERAVSKHEVSGLGLGLYIARRIVDAHSGTIRVESEPGDGATFTVELPLGGPSPRSEP